MFQELAVRRIVITSAATVSGVVLLLSLKPHSGAAASGAPFSAGTSPGGSTTEDGGGSSAATPGAGSDSGSSAATRSVTGEAEQTRFGPVQVKITVEGSKITDVTVLQYPSDNPKDQEINSYALPTLNQEAISAQSAGIDAVSGATFTSDGYTNSLQSAIDKAGL
ncbi:FMN-binding protein [Streptomyces sp. NBC_01800]|uniref:FMN-binding protein n=1 Tax=Streptomyces sp. NBC_01800 TaxID=2975945 RepID=UPI002DD9D999|nr:FMN-binding protein [Streptomyces sp. NBC_01800]WSA71883.1 FMN-binding protein [Streptomyces sp. NBC_01800]